MTSSADHNLTVRRSTAWEIGAVFLLFCLVGANATPNVNEAHYLGKARHYWNPQWCAGDVFLESKDAHEVFYWSFGWMTQVVSLPAAAWLGRLLTWLGLAWTWWRFSRAVIPGQGWHVAGAGLFCVLIYWAHMAGEWVIGGVEAKGFAYGFLFLGLESLVRGLWRRVWILFGIAAAFHVLVGGWAVVAAMLAWLLSGEDRPPLRQQLPSLCLGGLLSLPGLLPALWLNSGVTSDVVRLATNIYVYHRLPHHLVFHSIDVTLILRHGLLLLVVIGWARQISLDARQQRLARFVTAAIGLAFVGVAIDLTAEALEWDASSILRFYWFRLSDVMVPLAAALLVTNTVREIGRRNPRLALPACAVLMVIVATHLLYVKTLDLRDPRPPAVTQSMPSGESIPRSYRRFRDWKLACAWIKQHTEDRSRVLTPRYQQTFKWYAQRPEVANWKDIPQDAGTIVRWWQTMHEVYPRGRIWRGLAAHETELLRLADEHAFQYIVIDRSRSLRLTFPRVYPVETRDVFYEVYRVPSEVDPE